MSTVFDNTPKADTAPKRRSEDLYSYLSRSTMPGSEEGRTLIEDWFSRFPADEQSGLCSRFQSGRDEEFNAAFQELFLHELLLRLKCKLTVHPSVEGTAKKPDFRVQQPDGSHFLLEARSLAAVLGGHDNSPRGIMAWDYLDDLILKGYCLGVDELVVGKKNLQRKLLAKHIREGLQKTATGKAGRVSIPLFETDDGWRIKATAIPDSLNCEDATDRGVRYVALRRTRDDPSRRLLAALGKKGTRYGEQGKFPYLIAVNALEPFLEESAFSNALFGEHRQTPLPDTTSDTRTSCFWGTAKSPKHQRVSAVLFTSNLWYLALLRGEVRTRLYLNPWAHLPYDGTLKRLCTVKLEDGALKANHGTRVHELLQLEALNC